MPPRTSVIIPCFNAAPFLAETLDSVLGQTCSPCEIIVVDDHSTDDSRRIAERHPARPTLIASAGRGASAARNSGTRAATGDLIQYLDADDLLTPASLADRTAALEHASADVVIGDWQRLVIREGAWVDGRKESGRLPVTVAADVAIYKGFWAPPAAVLYRRSTVDAIGGWNETLPVIQDARFLFDAAHSGARFAHVGTVCARYREHDKGLSKSSPVAFWRDIFRNTQQIEELWACTQPLLGEQRRAIAGGYALGARMAFRLDEQLFNDFWRELRRFPEHRPSRYLRVAFCATRVLGYRTALRLLSLVAKAA